MGDRWMTSGRSRLRARQRRNFERQLEHAALAAGARVAGRSSTLSMDTLNLMHPHLPHRRTGPDYDYYTDPIFQRAVFAKSPSPPPPPREPSFESNFVSSFYPSQTAASVPGGLSHLRSRIHSGQPLALPHHPPPQLPPRPSSLSRSILPPRRSYPLMKLPRFDQRFHAEQPLPPQQDFSESFGTPSFDEWGPLFSYATSMGPYHVTPSSASLDGVPLPDWPFPQQEPSPFQQQPSKGIIPFRRSSFMGGRDQRAAVSEYFELPNAQSNATVSGNVHDDFDGRHVTQPSRQLAWDAPSSGGISRFQRTPVVGCAWQQPGRTFPASGVQLPLRVSDKLALSPHSLASRNAVTRSTTQRSFFAACRTEPGEFGDWKRSNGPLFSGAAFDSAAAREPIWESTTSKNNNSHLNDVLCESRVGNGIARFQRPRQPLSASSSSSRPVVGPQSTEEPKRIDEEQGRPLGIFTMWKDNKHGTKKRAARSLAGEVWGTVKDDNGKIAALDAVCQEGAQNPASNEGGRPPPISKQGGQSQPLGTTVDPPIESKRRRLGTTTSPIRFFNEGREVDEENRPILRPLSPVEGIGSPSSDSLSGIDWQGEDSLWAK